MGTQLSLPKKGHISPQLFCPCLLWSDGSMDQDTTRYGGRPWPRPHCVRWGPSFAPPPPKNGAQTPIFSPCLLWPNGWTDQDASWYEGRPRPMPHCGRWGTQLPPPRKRAQPAPIFGPCLLWPNGRRPSQLMLSTCTNGCPKIGQHLANLRTAV